MGPAEFVQLANHGIQKWAELEGLETLALSPPTTIANDAASAISRTTPSPISRMSLTARPVQMTVVPASHNHETTGGVHP